MARQSVKLLLVALVAALAATPSPAAYDHGPMRGKSDYSVNHRRRILPGPPLVLVENGQAKAEIVMDRRNLVTRLAATELQSFIEQATGARLPIVTRRSGNRPAIVLGAGDWTRKHGLQVKDLPRDAFLIRRVGDTVCILGRDDPKCADDVRMKRGAPPNRAEKATLFGAYDFAERFMGVRFYFPGEIGTVVPKTKTLSVPNVDVYEAPDFIQRKVSYSNQGWGHLDDPSQGRKLRGQVMLRLRAGTCNIPNCHGLARLGYIHRFGKTHPEYFSLLRGGTRCNDTSMKHSGHLCFSSPAVLNEIFEDAKSYFAGEPASVRGVTNARGRRGIWDWNAVQPGFFDVVWNGRRLRPGYFNVMPQDGLGWTRWCRCPKCGPYWDKGTQGELIWGYTVDIANRLTRAGIVGYVTNMAYGVARSVPKVDIPENVLVMIAIMGPWNLRNPEKAKEEFDLVKAWEAKLKSRKTWLWTYAIQAGGRLPRGVPTLAPRYYGAFFKRVAPHVFGGFVESENDYFLFNYLNWYVYHKVVWDTSTDVEATLAEHHRKLFGPAAEPMGRFFDRCEKLFCSGCLPEYKDTPLGPVAAKRTHGEIWGQVFTDPVMAEFRGLFAKADQLARKDPDSLKRVRWFKEKFLGEIERQRELHMGRKREIEDLSMPAPRVPEGQGIALDGKLDEPAWRLAKPVYLVPLDAKADAVVKTIVRVLWTPSDVYVGYKCEEPLVKSMTLLSTKRDAKNLWMDSSVEVFLDPSRTRRRYRQIMVNARGVVSDVSWVSKPAPRGDWAWNANVKAVGRIGAKGYVLEIRIPARDIAGKGISEGDTWVANFCRGRSIRGVTQKENQLQTWSPFLLRGFHNPERFGQVKFVKEVEPQGGIVENGSLERLVRGGRPAGWYPPRRDPDAWAMDDGTHRDGGRSIRLSNATGKAVVVTQYLPKMKPNTKYVLTYFVKAKDVRRVPGRYRNYGGGYVNVWAARNFNQFMPREAHRGTFGWRKIAHEFTSPPGTNQGKTRAYLRLCLNSAKGVIWFDDVRLREAK